MSKSRTSPDYLLAFTSLPPNRPLYKRDALNLLALPNGWNVEWSYRDKWIEPSLTQSLLSNELVGRPVLLVLCGTPDSVKDRFLTAVPVRWGTVSRSRQREDDPEVYDLRLELSRRVTSAELQDELSEELLPKPAAETSPYLRLRTTKPPAADEREVNWNAIVKSARQIPEVKACLLFHVIDIAHRARPNRLREWFDKFCRSQENRSKATVHPSATPGVNRLDLIAGELYELSLYVHKDSVSSNDSPIALLAQASHLAVSEPLASQHGSGAVVTFLLAVQRQYISDLSTLVLRPKQQAVEGPSIEILVSMAPRRAFWPATVLGLAIGWVLRSSAGHVDSHRWAWSLGLELVGILLIAATLFWAFRRLPLRI